MQLQDGKMGAFAEYSSASSLRKFKTSYRRKPSIVTAQKVLKNETKKQARKAEQNLRQLGPIDRYFAAQNKLQESGVSIPDLLQKSLIVSLTFGTAFQVTHNNGLLPVWSSLCPSSTSACLLWLLKTAGISPC